MSLISSSLVISPASANEAQVEVGAATIHSVQSLTVSSKAVGGSTVQTWAGEAA